MAKRTSRDWFSKLKHDKTLALMDEDQIRHQAKLADNCSKRGFVTLWQFHSTFSPWVSLQSLQLRSPTNQLTQKHKALRPLCVAALNPLPHWRTHVNRQYIIQIIITETINGVYLWVWSNGKRGWVLQWITRPAPRKTSTTWRWVSVLGSNPLGNAWRGHESGE